MPPIVRFRVLDSELPLPEFLPSGTVLPLHYSGTSKSKPVIEAVRACLRRGVPLADLIDVPADQWDYDALFEYRISEETAAAWFRFGFTPDEVLSWRDKGIRSSAAVAPLRELGITPLNYVWFSHYGDRGRGGQTAAQRLTVVARQWRAGLYGPDAVFDDAVYWDETGYTADVITGFIADGIDYGPIFAARKKYYVHGADAVRYVIERKDDSNFDPLIARWIDLGFTEIESHALREVGADLTVAGQISNRYNAEEIVSATKAGVVHFYFSDWDFDTAVELHEAGVSAHRADELYDLGLHDVDLILAVHRGEIPLEWALSFSGAEVVDEADGSLGFIALAA